MDFIKRRHIEAFDEANLAAFNVDPTRGDDFKTAFVAVLMAEAKRRKIIVHPTLDPDRPAPEKRRFKIPDGYLSADEAADYLGVPVAGLYSLRKNNRGPKSMQQGRLICYALEDLDAYKATME